MIKKFLVTEVNFHGCAGDQHTMVPRDIGKIRRGEGGGWLHPQLHEVYFDTEEEAVKAIESWGFNKTFYSIITIYRKES